jgi:fatty acid desaturase
MDDLLPLVAYYLLTVTISAVVGWHAGKLRLKRDEHTGMGAVLVSLVLVLIVVPIGPVILSSILSEGFGGVPTVLSLWGWLLLLSTGSEGVAEFLLLIVVLSVAVCLLNHALGRRAAAEDIDSQRELQSRIIAQKNRMEEAKRRYLEGKG